MSSLLTSALGDAAAILSRMGEALKALLESVDDSTFTTVMGSGCKSAGKAEPSELAARIRSDATLLDYMPAGSDGSKGRKAVRKLLDDHGTTAADAVFNATVTEYSKLHTIPAAAKASEALLAARDLENKLVEVTAAASRIAADPKHARSEAAEARFDASLKVVTEAVDICKGYKAKMGQYSDQLSAEYKKDPVDTKFVKQLQAARDGLKKEIQYINNQLIEHFDGGLDETHSDTKFALTSLEIPAQLEKGKGLQLITAVKAFLKFRAPQYPITTAYILRVLEEAKIGHFGFIPPNKADKYSAVSETLRNGYERESQEIYDELARKAKSATISAIRKGTIYGIQQQTAKCEEGDGVMAVFCMLALYRPADNPYRESIKDKLATLPSKMKPGSDPAVKITEFREDLQEALDLGIKIQWTRTGKPIVSILSERSNTLAAKLTKYTEKGAIADAEDAAVELDRMFDDIEQACGELEEHGCDIKRAGFANQVGLKRKRDDDDNGDRGKVTCWYDTNCTNKNCTFHHPNGRKIDKDTKRKDGDKLCQAWKCKNPSKKFRFCTKCHRENAPKGKIQISKTEWVDLKPSKADDKSGDKLKEKNKRINQLEKQLKEAKDSNKRDRDEPDADGDDSDDDIFDEPASKAGEGGPKSKRGKKRAKVAVFKRLGESAIVFPGQQGFNRVGQLHRE